MLQPPQLMPNDKAIIISPAGNIDNILVEGAASILSGWELNVEVSEKALYTDGRFSGSVQQRLSDLQNALDDSSIKVIFCSRGGYGIVHLLDKLDLTKFVENPKWVIGYSDITALHSLIQTKGVMSIHGPMAKHFSEEGENDPSVLYTKAILFGESINYEFTIKDDKSLCRNGKSTGILFGGNLAVLCSLMGTRMLHVPQDGILFVEDIGESPYKIDRLFNQLKLAGVFNKISGVIIGQFTEYKEDIGMYQPLLDSIASILSEYNFPTCFHFPVGHTKNNLPLVLGKEATLCVENNHIIFKQTL